MKKFYMLFTALLLSCFVISCSSDDNSSECYRLIGVSSRGGTHTLLVEKPDGSGNVTLYVTEELTDFYFPKLKDNPCVSKNVIDTYLKKE